MTVYVSQQPTPNKHNWVPNLGPATKYGEIKFIFQGDDQPYLSPDKSLDQAAKTLQNFDPEKDFLLWPNTGDPMAMWCAILALSKLNIHKLPFLYWNKPQERTEGRYKIPGYYAPIVFHLKESNNGIKRNNQDGRGSGSAGSGNQHPG